MKLVCGCEISKDERHKGEWGIDKPCTAHGFAATNAKLAAKPGVAERWIAAVDLSGMPYMQKDANGGFVLYDDLAAANAWKEAVINELVVDHILTKEHETNPRKALQDAITWNCQVALDPAVSSDARALVAAANATLETYRAALVAIRDSTYRAAATLRAIADREVS